MGGKREKRNLEELENMSYDAIDQMFASMNNMEAEAQKAFKKLEEDAERQWQQTRKRIELPGGKIVYQCSCGTNLASTVVEDGRTKFKLNLKGTKCRNGQCGKPNGFTLTGIARDLGAASVEDLLQRDGINVADKDREWLVAYFKSNYIQRAPSR